MSVCTADPPTKTVPSDPIEPINPIAASDSSPSDRVHRQRWWTLTVLCLTLVLISVDNTILNVAIPTLAREFDATGIAAAVDRRQLRPRVRRAAAHRRVPRRQVRPPRRASWPAWAIFGVGSIAASMAGSADAAHRLPGRDGRRRRADHAGDAVDPDQRLPRPEGAGEGDRHLGRLLRARRRARAGHRRLVARALLVGLGLPRQPAGPGARDHRLRARGADLEGRRTRRSSTSAAPCCRWPG